MSAPTDRGLFCSIDGRTVRVWGELDIESVDVLARIFDDLVVAGLDPVEIDAADLSFCDSTGVHCLLRLANRLPSGSVTLRSTGPALRQLVDLVDLGSTFLFIDGD